MKKHYQSDLDSSEPQPGLNFAQAWSLMVAGLRFLIAGLGIVATVLVSMVILVATADAEDWKQPELPCIPTVSDYDTYYRVEGKTFAIVWWCSLDDGLYTRWWTAQIGSPGVAEVLRLAGRDPDTFAAQAYRRESTPAEMQLVKEIELSQAPRCYVIGAGKTTAVLTSTAQHTIGEAKRDAAGATIYIPVGQQVVCLSRLPKETQKRYCEVRGSIDTKARLIEGDAWAPCRIERAPAEGWQ